MRQKIKKGQDKNEKEKKIDSDYRFMQIRQNFASSW